MSEPATLKEAIANVRAKFGELLYCAATGNDLPSESICNITKLLDSSGDMVAMYCGCGCLLESDDNYCPNCGKAVKR